MTYCPPDIEECQTDEEGVLISSRYGTVGIPQTPQFVKKRLIATPRGERKVRDWQVNIWAQEVARITTIPTAMLTLEEIVAQGANTSRLKARVEWEGASGGRQVDFDIAQGIRCVIPACYIAVSILFPVGGTVSPVRGAIQTGLGVILDGQYGGSLTKAGSASLGARLLTNTITERLGLGIDNVETQIPEGTRSVTVLQSADGVTVTPEFWLRGFDAVSATDGEDLGAILLGAERRADRVDRPGAASIIASGPSDPDNLRDVTYVFNLEL